LLPPSSLCSLRQFLRCGWRGDDRQNRIIIYGPKSDGTYIVEFKTAAGEPLTISVPEPS
jgi:hypothetical protein